MKFNRLISLGATLVLPDSINRLTGGSIYDKEVAARLQCEVLELPKSFPFPSHEDLSETSKLLGKAKAPLLIDGLAFGAFNDEILESLPVETYCLLHHPLFLEAGLSEDNIEKLRVSENHALKFAKKIIVTSHATKQEVHSAFKVPLEKIVVAEPGVTMRPQGQGKGLEILSVGTLSPRKNHIALLKALSKIKADWTLEIVGSKTAYPETANELEQFVKTNNLPVKLLGEQGQAELNAAYQRASIFVLPSLYEGYGMVLSEALSAGLAVITTNCAAAKTLPPHSCIIVDNDLEKALEQVFIDKNLRENLKINALKAVKKFNTWEDTAKIIKDILS